jgi:hypothetical protein
MKLSQLSKLTLQQVKETSYYSNLPNYLKQLSLTETQLKYEITTRYMPKYISGNPQVRDSIQALRHRGYYIPDILKQVRVFYPQYIDPNNLEDYLTRVPRVCVDGDRHIMLPNGELIRSDQIPTYHLLGYKERRLARKKVIASPALLFAMGGYPNSGITYLAKPMQIVILSMAGNQFEMDKLEYQDFIVDKTSRTRQPLFPQFYPKSMRTLTGISTARYMDEQYYEIDSEHFLDKHALLLSMIEDVTLLLSSFGRMISDGKRGYLHATALGAGYFAQFLGKKDISKLIYQTLLDAYEVVLKSIDIGDYGNPIRKIGTIILPDFTGTKRLYTPKIPNFGLDWITVKGQHKDCLDFRNIDTRIYTLGVINAGDSFAIPGNEFAYSSVEAMIGNNTDLRLMQNYHLNPYLLKRSNWVKINLRDPNHVLLESHDPI